jgi:heme exporter protein B
VREDWWAEVRAIFVKDLRSELRTKAALGAILAFAFTSMVLLSQFVVTSGLGLTTGLVEDVPAALAAKRSILENGPTEAKAALLSSLYWIVLYFSAMAGLPRVFVKEEEMRTAAALRLTARHSAVFTGKLCFNVALMVFIALLLLPVFVFFFQPEIRNWPMLVAYFVVGAAGLASGATILGAMVARTGSNSYTMVVLGFGPLLPILVFAVKGTTAALHGSAGNNLSGLVSYVVALVILSAGLFDRVWSD